MGFPVFVGGMMMAVLLAAVVGTVLLILALKAISRDGSPAGREQAAEETRLIQDMHQQLVRMEERVEALETILLERERKEKGS
jgi:phage shock protein B